MIDVDSLLEPISSDSPSGEDLRWIDGDTTFQTIEDNRVDEDPAIVVDREPRTADWKVVLTTASEALEGRSKDLQLAAWVTEGWTRTEGFAGLTAGLRLIRELVERYWETVHPGADPDEVVLPQRAKPISWLGAPAGGLASVHAIPFANEEHRWSDYLRALQIEKAKPEDARELMAQGGVSRDQWSQSLNGMPPDALTGLIDSVKETEAELRQLVEACDKSFGDDEAPDLGPLEMLLEEIRETLEPVAQIATGGAVGGAQTAGPAAAAAPVAAAGGGVTVSGPIQSRHEALQRLSEVAAFFRQTEPHSPVSYLVERAVRWGGMSLRQLLTEVVKSEGTLADIWETLGIDPEKPDSNPAGSAPPAAAPVEGPAAAPETTDTDDDW